jgi:C1A family cysteine protease
MSFKLNYKKAPVDSRDYLIKYPSMPFTLNNNLPQQVDLSASCTSVKNQGEVGSCTAFAGVGLAEFNYHKNNQSVSQDILSEKFLYFATRVDVAKWPLNEDSGAYIRDCMKALVKVGVCLENTFPYLRPGETASQYADVPPPSAYSEAKQYTVSRYANVSTEVDPNKVLNDLKCLLKDNYSFMAGITCHENFFNDEKGVIPAPQGEVIGGHAVQFVGYDDTKQLLKFKNSWGSDWGDNGYGYLPYSYILNRKVMDIWTIISSQFNENPFEVIVPQIREDEIVKRLNSILKRLSEVSIPTVIQEIKQDPNNSLLTNDDVQRLCMYAEQVNMTRFSVQLELLKRIVL